MRTDELRKLMEASQQTSPKPKITFGAILVIIFLVGAMFVIFTTFRNESYKSGQASTATIPTIPTYTARQDTPDFISPQPLTAKEKKARAKDEAAARKNYAHDAERRMLSQGFDFHIFVSGKDSTVIKYEFALMSRPLVYKLVNEHGILEELKDIGFKKAIFYDGYNYSWTYDLNNR